MDYDKLELKDGVHINEFDTSGDEASFLLSFENRHWKISEYLYNIITFIDGKRSLTEISYKMSEKLGAQITEENIRTVVDSFLIGNGLLEGTNPSRKKQNNGIGRFLWLKIPILGQGFIKKLKFLSILYKPNIFKILLILIAICISFALINMKFNIINLKFSNINYIYVLIIMVLATWIHEFGHVSACLRYNLTPERIGFAFYFTFPVLYSDVSCSWQLKRKQRVLVDVGGMYFELIYICAVFILGVVLNIELMKLAVILTFFSMQNNLNPIIKMDGYWVVSDLLGIPNLHSASIEYFKNILLKLFKVKTSKTPVDYIGKKERLFFIIYSVTFNVLMYAALFFMLKYSIRLPGIIYNALMNLFKLHNTNTLNFAYGIFNFALLIITIALIIRSMFFMVSASVNMIRDIIKGVLSSRSIETNKTIDVQK